MIEFWHLIFAGLGALYVILGWSCTVKPYHEDTQIQLDLSCTCSSFPVFCRQEKGIGKKNVLKFGPFSLSAFSSVFKLSLLMETVVRSDGIKQASSLAVGGAFSFYSS